MRTFENTYNGTLPDWAFDMAVGYARRLRFQEADIDDAIQEVAIAYLDFKFDPGRNSGATERTAIAALIRNILLKALRGRIRYEDRLDRYQREMPKPSDPFDTDDSFDGEAVRNAVADLDERDRHVCSGLGEGLNNHQIACRLGVTWRTVQRSVDRIRDRFKQLGLEEAVGG